MRRKDGVWVTIGNTPVSRDQQREFDKKTKPGDVIHKLFVVNPKSPLRAIEEVECRIIATEKRTWGEPIMPLRGQARFQKRLLLGAFAFYTRQQAVNKKLILLAQAMKAPAYGVTFTLRNEAWKQIEHYKATGEVK